MSYYHFSSVMCVLLEDQGLPEENNDNKKEHQLFRWSLENIAWGLADICTSLH